MTSDDRGDRVLGVAADAAGLLPPVEPASSLDGFATSIPNADDTAICPACDGSGSGVADTLCNMCGGAGGVPMAIGLREAVWRKWRRIEMEAGITDCDDDALAHLVGIRDGFSEAVQFIDLLTGGDGEYRYCTIPDERHCPSPYEMILRIVERAQRIEARKGGDAEGGSIEDESLVGEADAPVSPLDELQTLGQQYDQPTTFNRFLTQEEQLCDLETWIDDCADQGAFGGRG